jgi:hypothetical protein
MQLPQDAMLLRIFMGESDRAGLRPDPDKPVAMFRKESLGGLQVVLHDGEIAGHDRIPGSQRHEAQHLARRAAADRRVIFERQTAFHQRPLLRGEPADTQPRQRKGLRHARE